jgi:hypothetical protein
LPVNKTYHVSELTGGYHVYGADTYARHKHIKIIELPGLTSNHDSDRESAGEEKEASLRRWKHDVVDLSVTDFAMDPFQDLLVLLSESPPECVSLLSY